MSQPLSSAAPDLKLLVRKRYLLEALCWLAGIALLAFLEPDGEHLFSLCPFSWVLATGCPGCGLGHSIAWLFRGEFAASWEAHPLGGVALLLLAARLFTLGRNYLYLKNYYLKHKTNYDEHLQPDARPGV